MSGPPAATSAPCVLLFPGQSSVDAGMVQRARRLGGAAEAILERAEAVLGVAGVARYADAAGARLESNRDIQLSGFLTTQMHLSALEAAGVGAFLSLGMSLGEYSHLVHIGALAFEDALELVSARGAAYDTSPLGVMVAVLGASFDEVADAVARASRLGPVAISNFNTPTQHVLAGAREAVQGAAALLEEDYGASCVETESCVPMHSPLLAPVASTFRPSLLRAPWATPALPYLSNVTARLDRHPGPSTFVDRLLAHVTEPVRWRESVELVACMAPAACFLEVGPGRVVHNMLSRGWLGVRRACTDAPDAARMADAFDTLVRSLVHDE